MYREMLSEWKTVDRIIASRECSKNSSAIEYLVKWRGLPYSECTWESPDGILPCSHVTSTDIEVDIKEYQSEIDAFLVREQNAVTQAALPHSTKRPEFKKLLTQPRGWLTAELRDYQLEGLNWLIYSWTHNTNVILADEMYSHSILLLLYANS